MSTMKLRSLVFAGAAAAALAAPGAALAAVDDTSVTVTGGSLTYTTPFTAGDFTGVTLGATAQTTNADVADWTVTDLRGTLLGWNVTVSASQFTDPGADAVSTADDKTLPESSMSLVTAGLGTPTTDSSNLAVGPVMTAAAAIDGTGRGSAIALAAAGTGAGAWTMDVAADNNGLTLVVPTSAKAGTYRSTITTTLAPLV